MLTEFIEGAARELVEVHLSGTLEKPTIVAHPLRSVDAAIKTLFGAGQPPD